MINFKLKALGSFLTLGALFGLGLSVNAYNGSPTLTNDEIVEWSNYYNSVESDYNANGWYNPWWAFIQDMDDFQYSTLFNNVGVLNNGDKGMPFGVIKQNTNSYLDLFLDVGSYILTFNNSSNTDITINNLSIDAFNYWYIQKPNSSDLEFNSYGSLFNNTFVLHPGLTIIPIIYDRTLINFTNRYGSQWSIDGCGFGIDGGAPQLTIGFIGQNNLLGSLDFHCYNENYVLSYLSDYNALLNAESSGFERGYNSGQSDGYNSGFSAGQTDGYNSGYSNGLIVGYNQGVASVSDSNSTIMGLFGAIANVPITILNGVMGPTLLGVPLITILLNFLSVLLILWLIKKFIK